MPFADRDVLCVGCGVMFVFSAGEQEFFHEKGFTNEPKHCKECKAKRQRGGEQHNCPIQAYSRQTCHMQNVFRKQTQSSQ